LSVLQPASNAAAMPSLKILFTAGVPVDDGTILP
jgi:hypothetical protein